MRTYNLKKILIVPLIAYFALLLPFCAFIIIFFYFQPLSLLSLSPAYPSFFPFASLCRPTVAHIPHEMSWEMFSFFWIFKEMAPSHAILSPLQWNVACGLQDASRLLSFFGSGEEGGEWELVTDGKFSIFVWETSSRLAQLIHNFYHFKSLGKTRIDPLAFERKRSTAIRIMVSK